MWPGRFEHQIHRSPRGDFQQGSFFVELRPGKCWKHDESGYPRSKRKQNLRDIYIYFWENYERTMDKSWTWRENLHETSSKPGFAESSTSSIWAHSVKQGRNLEIPYVPWEHHLWIMFPFKFGSKFASSNFRFRSFMILICENNKSHEFTHRKNT